MFYINKHYYSSFVQSSDLKKTKCKETLLMFSMSFSDLVGETIVTAVNYYSNGPQVSFCQFSQQGNDCFMAFKQSWL